ncbi:MAG: flagellar basal body L-ring protein FlgH [Planctomycetes bacterium]|nr:flagellar basal body L-ring protein FlgH [Planctomycetota bacterium]
MKRRRQINYGLIMGVIFLMGYGSEARADSIWSKRSPNARDQYADDKANQIGDILTIVISESHKTDTKTKRSLERDSEREISFDSKDISVGSFHPIPDVSVKTGANKKLDGKSDYKDERTIEDRISVIVQDIHPNGNLVVIGSRTRDVNGDKQVIQVSGIVRPSDISYGNSIRSEQVANFQLVTISDGVSADYNNPGWLGKILDFVWPF